MPPTKDMLKKNRDKIPSAPRVEPGPKEILFAQTATEWRDKPLDEIANEYNTLEERKSELNGQVEKIETTMKALGHLIQKKIEASGADNMSISGFTWTPKAEAYASAEDNLKLIQHFIDNGQQHLLMIHASRLSAMVREEIDAGTILIEPKEVPDPETGGTKTVNEVRSAILPGVKVFLKDALGRQKSTRSKEKVEE